MLDAPCVVPHTAAVAADDTVQDTAADETVQDTAADDTALCLRGRH